MTPDQQGKRVQGLEGVRVLEFPDPKTTFCGKLLAELGADVVLVEPPQGAPLRRLPPHAGDSGEGLFFWYTGVNKRSVALDLGQASDRSTFLGLVKNADILIDPFPPGHLPSLGLDDATLYAANPRLVFASVTNFGRTGPFRDFASSEIVGWAMSGLMGLTGDPAREPLTAPAFQGFQMTSMWATISILASVYRRLKTGQGARLDLSLQDALFDMSETSHSFYLCNGEIVKRSRGDHPLACPFKVFKSKDGYAFISSSVQRMWKTLLDWMESTGVDVTRLRDPALLSTPARVQHRDEINAAVAEFALRVPTEELFLGAARRGIAAGAVRTVPEVMNDEQLLSRQAFGAMADPRDSAPGAAPGEMKREYPYPMLPFRGKEGPWRRRYAAAPPAGRDTDEVLREWSRPGKTWPKPTEPERTLPLEGAKMLEYCWHIAGPIMSRVLADLGATIIKIEAREVGDPSRQNPPFPNRVWHVNRGFTYQDMNRNKMSVTLNLKDPRARAVGLRLASWADVVMENFTAGTLSELGLGYEAVSRENPDIVMVSITGYGQTGPRRGWPCNHPTAAALAGLTGLFAYEGGEPLGFGHSHMDFAGGYLGAIAVMDALLRKESTAQGDYIDLSMLEAGVMLAGTQVLDWVINGHEPRAEGNRAGALGAALQGCYPCRGEDQWIAVTAPHDTALAALAQVTGAGARAPLHELELAIARWTSQRDPWEAFEVLQSRGIPAGVVSRGPDLLERDRHLQSRESTAWLPHAELGRIRIVQCPIFLDGKRLPVRRAGPLLGEHTEQVLRGIIGVSEQEYLDYVVHEVI